MCIRYSFLSSTGVVWRLYRNVLEHLPMSAPVKEERRYGPIRRSNPLHQNLCPGRTVVGAECPQSSGLRTATAGGTRAARQSHHGRQGRVGKTIVFRPAPVYDGTVSCNSCHDVSGNGTD